ncbi:MAG TPA: hypothetical protein PLX89_11180 [Verrucomicrobiota bacterium]|nr:hypothetical protein [Verrucomicrobiota bacterium]
MKTKEKKPSTSDPFEIIEGHRFHHPSSQVSISNLGGVCLEINQPGWASSKWMFLSGFPKNTWVDIEDESGQLLPFSIFVNPYGRVSGVWKAASASSRSPSGTANVVVSLSELGDQSKQPSQALSTAIVASRRLEIEEVAKTNPEMARRMTQSHQEAIANEIMAGIRHKQQLTDIIFKNSK